MEKHFLNRIKEYIKSCNCLELICLGVLAIQMIFVVYTNLFRIPDTLDNDVAKLFLHVIEMWDKKSIFLEQWSNMTTLEVDCATVLALPIWILCRNIYISFGLANILFVGIYFYIGLIILDRLKAKRVTKLVTLIMIVIPYSFGQLLYYNMMFFAGGQYVVKVLVPLLYIVVLTADNLQICDKIIAFVAILLTLIMGVSSGPYVLAVAVAPACIGYFLFDVCTYRKIKELICFKTIFLATSGTVAILGEFICIKQHVNTTGNSMQVVAGEKVIESFIGKINATLEILGGWGYETYAALSAEGIVLIVRYVFAFLFIGSIVCACIWAIKKDKFGTAGNYIACFIIFDYFVVWLTDSNDQARYTLVAIVPAIFLVTVFWQNYICGLKSINYKCVLLSGTVILIFVEVCIADMMVLMNKSYPYFESENRKYREIVSFVESQPEKHIFVMDDNGQPEVYRILGFGDGKEYLVYLTESQSIEVYDYYWSDEYYEWLDDSFLLVGCDTNTSIENMPLEIQNRAEKIAHVQNYSIYRVK